MKGLQETTEAADGQSGLPEVLGCDHTIGVNVADDGGFIKASQFIIEARRLREIFNNWKQNPNASVHRIRTFESATDYEFINDKYELFDYCPDCGSKLRLGLQNDQAHARSES